MAIEFADGQVLGGGSRCQKKPCRSMPFTVAIQMDPIERIDIAGDSTFALALEAQTRGHALLYYGPRDLTFRDGAVTARCRELTVRDMRGDHFTLGEPSM